VVNEHVALTGYEITKRWRATHKAANAKLQQRYYIKHKKRLAVYRAEWKRRNWGYYKNYLAARKSRVKIATPPWADLDGIVFFYLNCPPGHHVDHIIPLNGRLASGLHTLENLQYLPAKLNLKKSNKS
jgi:hypothetical protein